MDRKIKNFVGKNVSKSFVRRSVVLSRDIDEAVEKVRGNLGMSRSGLIRYSVLRMLEELNILSAKAHRKAGYK
jgi:hypothetical protein